jgi:hypothetical protein
VSAEKWSQGASVFADAAVAAGSTFATFFVGSVKFYCCDADDKEERKTGAALLAKAAVGGSPEVGGAVHGLCSLSLSLSLSRSLSLSL